VASLPIQGRLSSPAKAGDPVRHGLIIGVSGILDRPDKPGDDIGELWNNGKNKKAGADGAGFLL
jgi:hypothetical protein